MALCPLRTTADACAAPNDAPPGGGDPSLADCEWIEDGRDDSLLYSQQQQHEPPSSSSSSSPRPPLHPRLGTGPTTAATAGANAPSSLPWSSARGRCVLKRSAIETATQPITDLILHWKPPQRRLDVQEWDRALHNLRLSRVGLEIIDRAEAARSDALFLRQAQFKRMTLPLRALFVYAYQMWRSVLTRRTAAELRAHLDTTLQHIGHYEAGTSAQPTEAASVASVASSTAPTSSVVATPLFEQIQYGVEDLAPAFACVYELTIAAGLPSTTAAAPAARGSPARLTDVDLVQLLLERLEPDSQELQREHQIHTTLRRTLDWAQYTDPAEDESSFPPQQQGQQQQQQHGARDVLFPAWNVQFATSMQAVRLAARAFKRTLATIRDDLGRMNGMPASERERTCAHLVAVWQPACVGAVMRALLIFQSEAVVLLLLHHYQTAPGRRLLDAHLANVQSQFSHLSLSYAGARANDQDACVYHQVRLLSHEIWLLEKARYLVEDTSRALVQAVTSRRIARVLHTFLALWSGEDQLPGWTQADSDAVVDECLDPLQLPKLQQLLNMRLLLVALDQPPTAGPHQTTVVPVDERESPQFQVLAHVWRQVCAHPNATTGEVVSRVRSKAAAAVAAAAAPTGASLTSPDDTHLLTERVAEVWDSIQGNIAAPPLIQNALFAACCITITQDERSAAPNLPPSAHPSHLLDIEREATHLLVETLCRVVQEQLVQGGAWGV